MEASSPAVVVSIVATLAAVGLAAEGGFSHWTVPATGPWAVAGGAVTVASSAGVYDSLRWSVSVTLLVSVLAVLAAASWVVVGRLVAGREAPYRERYLAAAGVGVSAVVLVALFGHLAVPSGRLVWVVIVPVATAVLAAVGFLTVGFLFTGLLTDLRLSGLYTVGAVVFEGAASVAAGELFAADGGVFASALRSAIVAADVAPVWWISIAGHLAVGLAVVAVCGRLSRWRTDAGRAVVLVVSVVTLWSGCVVLVSAVSLG